MQITVNNKYKMVVQEKINKRVTWLQYLNTGLISLVLGIAMMISSTVQALNNRQVESEKEDLRLKTVQDMNVKNVEDIDRRVLTLEGEYFDNLKAWVEANYVRKPQTK
jgi:hypothetical protein